MHPEWSCWLPVAPPMSKSDQQLLPQTQAEQLHPMHAVQALQWRIQPHLALAAVAS